MTSVPCVFCDIVAGRAPAYIVERGPGWTAFTPLNPVTPGHTLVVPTQHVEHFTENAMVTALVVRAAAVLAAKMGGDMNLITSKGPSATQTVKHLHIHLVPRAPGDGLVLPWTGQRKDSE